MGDMTAHDQEQREAEYKAAVTQLWGVAIGCFGERWVRDYGEVGEEVFQVWVAALKCSYTPQTIRSQGALIMSTWTSPHPPALGQFRTELSMRARETSHKATKQLERPRTSPAKAKAILQAAAEALANNSGQRDESFLQAYRDLELHKRWGSDDPVMG